MIRVVNLDMMGGFLDGMRESRSPLSYMVVLLVVSGCTDGYDDLEERVRCVFMGDVTWNRVGCVDSKNTIYRWIQSPRSIFLCVPQWSMADFKKTKAYRLLVAQIQLTMVTYYCRCPSVQVRRDVLSYTSLALILSK